MQSSKYALIAVVTLCAGSIANADPGDIYVEGVVGTFADEFYLDDENDYSVIGARAGYDINSYFALEGEYMVGTNTHERSFSTNRYPDLAQITGTRDLKLHSVFGIYGKASIPFGDRFALHARAGYADREVEITGTTLTPEFETPILSSGTSSEDYLSYGVGGSFDFTENLYARADVTGYAQDVFSDIYSATVSVGIRF